MQDNIIRILWTGGWDSTYRIIQLSRRGGVTLQPIYVEDKGRGSVAYELKAIEELSSLISQRESVTILPLIIVDKDKIPENPEITEAYLLFKKEADMGSQHDWLARQLAEEKRALRRMSEMFDIKISRSKSWDAESLKRFHAENCSAEGVDDPTVH